MPDQSCTFDWMPNMKFKFLTDSKMYVFRQAYIFQCFREYFSQCSADDMLYRLAKDS